MFASELKVLIFGGTGAMGKYLINLLTEKGHHVTVTSRRKNMTDNPLLRYIEGNAHGDEFLHQLLTQQWDVIIDFMVYTTTELKNRIDFLLSNCKQYIFISSARVYAKSDEPIKESSPRLLDVSEDQEYLKTDEYALAKAREEDIIMNSKYNNYTIIRPSITYGANRLQLGVLEKENWLYRALSKKTIVFSNDIGTKLTAMTNGYDVAVGIAAIVGKQNAYGRCFHITDPKSYLWNDVLNVYLDAIEELLGFKPKVMMTNLSTCFDVGWNKYQIIYCRYFNRTFDNSAISEFVDVNNFKNLKTGIYDALNETLENLDFKEINWKLEAVNDRVAHEWTNIFKIKTLRKKLVYVLYRTNAIKYIKRR